MNFFQRVIITLGYLLCLALAVLLVLRITGKINAVIDFKFPYFDSEHYEAIKNGNYNDWRSAFFPGFPLLWRILSVDNFGICLINLALFTLSYSLLSKCFNFSFYAHLIGLMLPSIVFFALPYSESLFFLSTVLVLVGLNSGKSAVFLLGIVMASFVRPVIMILIPALLLLLLVEYFVYRRFNKTIVFGIIISILSLAGVFAVQYFLNGKAFGFFHSQSEGWGNSLRFPTFPLSSWAGNFITMYDGLALWISIVFGWIGMGKIIYFNRKSYMEAQLPPAIFLSLIFVFGTAITVLLTRGGLLFSLNRFVFLTPFYVIAFQYVVSSKLELKKCLIVALSFLIFSVAMGSYVHIQLIIEYLLLSALIFMIVFFLTDFVTNKSIVKWIPVLTIFILQVYMIIRALQHEWIA